MKALERVSSKIIMSYTDSFLVHLFPRESGKSESAASKLDTISEEGGKQNGGTYVPKGNYQLALEFPKHSEFWVSMGFVGWTRPFSTMV